MDFDTIEPGGGYADLLPFLDMIGDARVVGLGESTHGTREFHQLRHRLIEMLAVERGFTAVALEECMPNAYRVNEYVRHGRGDLDRLVEENLYWAMRTSEMLALFTWMRSVNAVGRGPIDLAGCDMQSDGRAVEIVLEHPEVTDALRARYERVLEANRDWRIRGRGIQAWFPVEEARGRQVCLSGFLRTRGADESAFLWIGAGGETGSPVVDNMEDRRPDPDSVRSEHAVTVDVPEDAFFLTLGACLGGNGTLRVDGLRLEIDGETWCNTDRLDIGFATDDLVGWWIDDRNTVTREGQTAICIEPAEQIPPCDTTEEEAHALAVEAHQLIRAALTAEPDGWTVRLARMIVQAWEMRTGGGDECRARSMAENILWLLERDEHARVVFWAHNGHVRRGVGETGAHLARALGPLDVPVALTTAEGSYLASHTQEKEGLGEHPLAEPPPESFEARLAELGRPRSIFDLRTIGKDDPELGFLTETRPFRMVGGSALPNQFLEHRLRDDFDLLVYVQRTTAARPIPGSF